MPFRVRFIGDKRQQPKKLKAALDRAGAHPVRGAYNYDEVVDVNPFDAFMAAVHRIQQDPEWMAFDLLVLDVRYDNHDFGGFEVVYDQMKEYVDKMHKENEVFMPRQPWKHVFVSTMYLSGD